MGALFVYVLALGPKTTAPGAAIANGKGTTSETVSA